MKDKRFETFTDFFNEAVLMKKIPTPKEVNISAGGYWGNKELANFYSDENLQLANLKLQFIEYLKAKKGISQNDISEDLITENLTHSNFIQFFKYIEGNTDPRYVITIDVSKKADFVSFRNRFLEHGFFHITNTGVKIYNLYLAFILLHKELPVKNLENEKELLLNCFVYSETFEKAYNEGVTYFKENFSANTNTLYGPNADAYTNNILEHYLTKETEFNGITIKGWKGIETYYPEIITHKVIYKAGYFMGIVSEAKELFKNHSKVFEKYFTNNEPTPTNEGNQPQQNKIIIPFKPQFNSEIISDLFNILKEYFEPTQHENLKQLLTTGNNVSQKLLFKGNGNRLCDTFKQLIQKNLITPFDKKKLIEWVVSNFMYLNKGIAENFNSDTVAKTISRDNYPCKSPIIKVENGEILKTEQAPKRKQSKKQ
jgi:hypothetical protein